MEIVQFVDFSVGLCYLIASGLYLIVTSLLATGRLLFCFLSNGCNGIATAFDFVPTCTGNPLLCGFRALQIIMWELNKTFDNPELQPKFLEILICLIIVLVPYLREIVSACLTFLISLIIALVFAIFHLQPIGRLRPVVGSNAGRLKWYTIVKNAFKKLFKSGYRRRPTDSTSPRRENSSDTTNCPDLALTCLVCYENPKCVLLMPCKHVCYCLECAASLLNRQRQCPLCRKNVISVMRIYI